VGACEKAKRESDEENCMREREKERGREKERESVGVCVCIRVCCKMCDCIT